MTDKKNRYSVYNRKMQRVKSKKYLLVLRCCLVFHFQSFFNAWKNYTSYFLSVFVMFNVAKRRWKILSNTLLQLTVIPDIFGWNISWEMLNWSLIHKSPPFALEERLGARNISHRKHMLILYHKKKPQSSNLNTTLILNMEFLQKSRSKSL